MPTKSFLSILFVLIRSDALPYHMFKKKHNFVVNAFICLKHAHSLAVYKHTEALTFILALALVGQTAYLHCGVDRLGDRAVSIHHSIVLIVIW